MSEKEEGVHQVLREPSGRAREPEQGAHRRAQVPQGTLLPTEGRVGPSCDVLRVETVTLLQRLASPLLPV